MSATELVTEFLLAAEEGNSDALKACLEKGVDINATNRQKRTAVTIASLKKHYSCVALLIAAGADIDKQDQTCFNPFLISCLTNDLTLLRLVLPANPDLDRLTRFGGVGIGYGRAQGRFVGHPVDDEERLPALHFLSLFDADALNRSRYLRIDFNVLPSAHRGGVGFGKRYVRRFDRQHRIADLLLRSGGLPARSQTRGQ